MHVGYNIKRIREIRGYSQKAIADKLGMSVTGYGNIERGITEVKGKRLIQIANALGVSIAVIQNFDPDTYFNNVPPSPQELLMTTGNVNFTEKELYQKIIQQKDDEIAYLRTLLKKKFK